MVAEVKNQVVRKDVESVMCYGRRQCTEARCTQSDGVPAPYVVSYDKHIDVNIYE